MAVNAHSKSGSGKLGVLGAVAAIALSQSAMATQEPPVASAQEATADQQSPQVVPQDEKVRIVLYSEGNPEGAYTYSTQPSGWDAPQAGCSADGEYVEFTDPEGRIFTGDDQNGEPVSQFEYTENHDENLHGGQRHEGQEAAKEGTVLFARPSRVNRYTGEIERSNWNVLQKENLEEWGVIYTELLASAEKVATSGSRLIVQTLVDGIFNQRYSLTYEVAIGSDAIKSGCGSAPETTSLPTPSTVTETATLPPVTVTTTVSGTSYETQTLRATETVTKAESETKTVTETTSLTRIVPTTVVGSSHGELGDKCLPAVAGLTAPLVGIVALTLGNMVHSPQLDAVNNQINEQLALANAKLQSELGLYNDQLAQYSRQVEAALNSVSVQAQHAGGLLAAAVVVLGAAATLAEHCGTGSSVSEPVAVTAPVTQTPDLSSATSNNAAVSSERPEGLEKAEVS